MYRLLSPQSPQRASCRRRAEVLVDRSALLCADWDVHNMSAIRVVDGSDSADVNSLHVSQDGSFFVSGGADKRVNVWNYDEGSRYYVGEGHSGSVCKVRISPDEKRIISVGTEGGIFLWKVPDAVKLFSK